LAAVALPVRSKREGIRSSGSTTAPNQFCIDDQEGLFFGDLVADPRSMGSRGDPIAQPFAQPGAIGSPLLAHDDD
jgi:hypothetical protein